MAEPIELIVNGPNGSRTVRVSNPDKVYFPELSITKLDVVHYFLSVGDGIIEALRERPTTLERWPGGVVPGARLTVWNGERGQAFFQKRLPKGAPEWVETARGDYPDEVCPTEVAVVAWAASLGTLTFHPWSMRRPYVDIPDQLRIDLDPQPGTDFEDAVRVALALRELLTELGMVGFPKTSGGRGVHVHVPIEPLWAFTDVLRGVFALGCELVRRIPDQVTINWFKKDRGANVYFDYGQIRTIASAYSIRPTPRARVSAPVSWDELPIVTPDDFDVSTMPARFADVGDMHSDLARRRFSIEPLLEMAERDERAGIPYPPAHRGLGLSEIRSRDQTTRADGLGAET